MSDRPSIPADLKRRVLIEAGHRCAIPTCRHMDVDVHHIVPWETCQCHDYANLIALCPNCHRRAHKGEIDRKSLRIYKANLRFAHDRFSQLEIDTLFELGRLPAERALLWPQYMWLLLKRLFDAGYVVLGENHDNAIVGSTRLQPDFLLITDKGRHFLQSLELQQTDIYGTLEQEDGQGR